MLRRLLVLLLLLLVAPRALTAQDSGPRAARRAALHAVEGDSVARMAARWRARPDDHSAALGLATIAALTYDHAAAARAFGALANQGAVPRAHVAHALLGLGWIAFDAGDYATAARHFARARAASRDAGDRAAEAEALVGAARASAPRVQPLALLDTAERLLGGDGDRAVRAAARAHRAWLLAHASDSRAAAEADAARLLARSAGAGREEALALYAHGARLRLGHLADSTLLVFREVARRQESLRDRAALANTLVSIADIVRQQEEFVEARTILREAARAAKASGNRRALTRVDIGLGVIAMAFRDHASAATHLAAAVASAGALADTSTLLTARAFQAYHYLGTGQIPEARAASSWALARFRAAERWYESVIVATQLAAIELRAGAFDDAERLLAEADSTARHRGLAFMVPGNLGAHGRLALARGRHAEARTLFARQLPELGEQERAARYTTRLAIAWSDAAMGAGERAEREALGAAAEFDRWRASLTDDEERLLVFQTEDERADRDAVAAATIAALAAAGRVDAAFRLAEHRRARMLAERVARTNAAAGRAGAPASPEGADTTVHPTLVRDVAAVLPDDGTALLEYVTGEWNAPTTLFVLRRAGGRPVLRAFRLPAADSLRAPTGRLVALLESRGDPSALARTLGAALLDSAAAVLGPEVTRLVVVPDGALHRVPFDVLRLADGRHAVERFAIGIVPSSTVLAALRTRPSSRRDGAARLLAFGDPAFGGSAKGESRDAFRSAFDSAGGLPRLAGSGREARLVARYADDAVVRLGESATAEYLLRAPLDSFAVLHFATHALVDERASEHTALALAPSDSTSGFVPAVALADLRLRADLVVLSACRSGSGALVGGEGILGLTAPLLAAGARAVVATGWRIRDRETVDFVRDLYDALAAGMPAADALRAAKLAALRRGAPPAEWAAFQVVGDPLARVPLRAVPRRPWAPWAFAGTASLLLLAGAAAYGRRRRSGRAAERVVAPSAA